MLPKGRLKLWRITGDVKPGDIFTGKVMRIMPFGAFVEFLPARKDSCIYPSLQQATKRVEDVVNIGDVIRLRSSK